MGNIALRTYDRLNEPSSMRIGADNLVTGPDVQALVDAVDAIILGSDVRGVSTVETVVDAGAAGPSTDENADRFRKWLFRSQTSAGIFTNEIGTADNTVLPGPGSDFLDLTAGVGLALKTAWDAVYQDRFGNVGVLLSAQQIGRQE